MGRIEPRARLGLAPGKAPATKASKAAIYAAAEQEALEEQNEVLASKLASKVEELRDLSLGIASEASAVDLEEMSGRLGRAQQLLSSATLRLRKAAESPGSRHMCLTLGPKGVSFGLSRSCRASLGSEIARRWPRHAILGSG